MLAIDYCMCLLTASFHLYIYSIFPVLKVATQLNYYMEQYMFHIAELAEVKFVLNFFLFADISIFVDFGQAALIKSNHLPWK